MTWIKQPRPLAFGVLIAGLAIATAAGIAQRSVNDAFARTRFEELAHRAASQVHSHLHVYAYGLYGARGAIVATGVDGINRERFRQYAASRSFEREFPGALGFGFIRRVPVAEEDDYVARARRDGAPDFTLRPPAPSSAERAVIQYLEPEQANRAAIGFDIASDERQLSAARAAIASGQPTMSAPTTLEQAPGLAARAVRIFLPVFEPGPTPATPDERAARTLGWVFAPLVVARALLASDDSEGLLNYSLLDVSDPQRPEKFFDTEQHDANAELVSRVALDLYGRAWQIEVRSLPGFRAQLALRDPRAVGAIVFLLGMLCAGLVYHRRVSAQRAHELHAHQARLARVVENANDAIIGKTLEGVITSWNKAAERIFGYSAEEALGRTVLELLLPEDRFAEEADILARLSRGEHVERLDTVRRRRDGSTVEVEVASSPILDEHGRVLGVAKIITDISHKKALERSLLALNATLEEQVRERTALLNSARRDLDNILDALPVMIAYWDREQRCRFANRAYAAWFGLEPQAVIGALLRDLFGPRYAVNLPFVERALRGESITLDREVPGPDGGPPRQVEIHYLPDSVDGDVPGFYLIAHNVTEQIETRARLAAALRETDALLSVIHQHAIVSMTDRAGKIIDVNDAFCRISGYSRDELMGADHRLINSHVHGSSFWRDMWRTIRASKPWRHVVCNRAKDGTLYWVDSIIAPLLSDNGAPTKFISIRFDITAAKRAELALRESERLQRGLLAHAGSAIIATDPHGTITLWNRAAQGLLGYEEHEVVATSTPTLFLAPDELASRRTQLEAAGISASSAFEVLVARARLERVDTSEWTYVRKDGSHVPVLLTVGSLRDESGEISGYLTTAVDLSARKQQEGELVELNRLLAERSRQAESANQAKSLFLANMSHEIRTPLNAVVGLTYLLEQGTLDPDQRDLVKKVKLASRSLLGVINDVLDLSKIEAGELEIEEAAFDLRSLLEELVSVMHVQASAKAIALTSYVDDAAPNVLHGDGLHLQQILTNLLSNAIKFTERGTVSLSVSALDLTDRTAKLVFTVKDSGIGIDPSVQERIFAPFTQADVSTTRRFGGTGLGLSIVKRLVTLMGGEVTMTSALGVGTEFAVSLPFLRDQRVPSGPARPLNVLVAGEEASACEQLSDLARALGWHAETVSTGDAALARLRARLVTDNPVELVIVPVRSVNPVIQQRLTELAHALPVQQRPALVVAVADRAVALEAATWTAESTAVVLSDGTSASALFNAVQEALAKRASAAGIDPKGVTGAETDVSSSSLAGKHVLVVDDSEINLMIATRILGLAGAQVTSAANGQEAVDLLRMRPRAFDAVLMDVQMPVLDGLEATRRIRRALGLTALPIIALTAGALVAERHRATAAGVDDFISKPFDPPTMIHKLVQRIAPASAGKAVTELRAHAPAQVPADWPVIEGLDTGAAVASSGADRALLAQLLRTLFEQFSDLEQLTSVVDPSLMATRLHKLRGIAGTLGAAALTEAATRWELALRSQPSDPAEELGACVGRELARLRKSAERALPTSERPAATSRMRTAQSAAPAGDLSVLMALLERQSFKALEVFAALSPMLREQMTESELDGLRGAIDALEYHHALKTLERLFHKTETGWRRSTG